MKVHLDTDLGGDSDDACALAYLLGRPEVELASVTSTDDPDGDRAEEVRHCLRLAGRPDVPVAVGGTEAAEASLAGAVGEGAVVLAIGPYSNLAALERAEPGALAGARVVAMGGWLGPLPEELPAWGPDKDWNVQRDRAAAEVVLATAGDLTLVTLAATMRAHLRAADLPRLAAAGPFGAHLAERSAAHGREHGMAELGRAHAGLPDDLVNFHYDPMGCAVALGWPGAAVEHRRVRPVVDGDGLLRLEEHPDGRPIGIVPDLDATGFTEHWLTAVEAAAARAGVGP